MTLLCSGSDVWIFEDWLGRMSLEYLDDDVNVVSATTLPGFVVLISNIDLEDVLSVALTFEGLE